MKNLRPINEPIILSSTFIQKTPCQEGYSRVDNPTRLTLEKKLATLEKARFALSFSSGSAAITTILTSLKSGDHILCHEEIYEGTLRLLEKVFNKFGVTFTLTDLSESELIKKKIRANTKIIWLENITNPTLKIVGIAPVCKVAKKYNIKVVVDNTFCTPIFENPLEKGADVVVHSLTKYISGHHNVLGGAIMLNNQEYFQQLKMLQHTIGAVLSPFDCFLVAEGLKTLSLRMEKHTENAKKVSDFLKTHIRIESVSFPGVSGMVSFWIKGNKKNTLDFLKKLRLIRIAHSLGGTESIILHPSTMMRFSLPKKELMRLGITNNLVRLSVGLENNDKIIKDLKQALD